MATPSPSDSDGSIWTGSSVFDGWKAFLWLAAFIALMLGVVVPGLTRGDWSGSLLWGGLAGVVVLIAVLAPNRPFS
jgi:hypothetical protein